MKPLVVFADAEDALIGYLADSWAAHPDAPETITNAFPRDPLAAGATHLQVELDGTPGVFPNLERASVRFTCWADPTSPSAAKQLATRTQALVYTHPGDDDVCSTQILTGRGLRGQDRDSENHFVSFTARVNLRPQPFTHEETP